MQTGEVWQSESLAADEEEYTGPPIDELERDETELPPDEVDPDMELEELAP